MNPIVVIGGSAAGMSAASQIKRQLPESEVIVFSDEDFGSYGACGMPFYISGEIQDYRKLIVLKPEKITQERKILYKSRHKVISINPQEKSIQAQHLDTGLITHQTYEKLAICTGAAPVIPPFENVHLKGIFTLKTLQDSIDINAYLETQKPQKVLIVGGGFIGVEAAESFSKRGLKVSVVEAAPSILSVMDRAMSQLVTRELEKNKVQVYANSKLKGFSGGPFVKKAILDSGEELEADLVLLSIGVSPNSQLAQSAQLKLGERNAILVDAYQKTNHADIYAAGDCATVFHQILKQDLFVPLALGANRQGRICGENICAELLNQPLTRFPGIIGTSMTKCFDLEISKTGLGEADISRYSLSGLESVTIEYFAKAGYYPQRSKIWVTLYFQQKSQIIQGAQIVGQNGSALRIDVISAAIAQKMTLKNLYDLDLGYCPPFSPVWDPLLVAARAGMKQN